MIVSETMYTHTSPDSPSSTCNLTCMRSPVTLHVEEGEPGDEDRLLLYILCCCVVLFSEWEEVMVCECGRMS